MIIGLIRQGLIIIINRNHIQFKRSRAISRTARRFDNFDGIHGSRCIFFIICGRCIVFIAIGKEPPRQFGIEHLRVAFVPLSRLHAPVRCTIGSRSLFADIHVRELVFIHVNRHFSRRFPATSKEHIILHIFEA